MIVDAPLAKICSLNFTSLKVFTFTASTELISTVLDISQEGKWSTAVIFL